MNPLTDKFPEAARINGKVYALNTDFRVGLKIMAAFEDSRLTGWEKQVVMCSLLFSEVPPDFNAACAAAVKFLDCGEGPTDEGDAAFPRKRVYSWTKDAKYIYSGILQTHGIDLQRENMHWWKFMALFSDLSENCTFERIVAFRRRANSGKMSKEERKVWYEMRDVLSLDEPEEYTPEEQNRLDEFNALLGGESL